MFATHELPAVTCPGTRNSDDMSASHQSCDFDVAAVTSLRQDIFTYHSNQCAQCPLAPVSSYEDEECVLHALDSNAAGTATVSEHATMDLNRAAGKETLSQQYTVYKVSISRHKHKQAVPVWR